MLFLQARGHKCSTPVPSNFGTFFVMCKIPRSAPPSSVVLATDGSNKKKQFEVEIYKGEEYCEEEYFVCAVQLLNFVPGKALNEVPPTTRLMFDAGMAVGRLDRDLKVESNPAIS